MPAYKYLIVGGGMTADSAVSGIRQVDADGTIGLISAETDNPYNRPPLTKQLWKGKPFDSIWRKGVDADGVTLHLSRNAVSLDVKAKQVRDDQGDVYTYEKLLLATGGTPRRLPFGGDNIIYYRTVNDYRHLRDLADRHENFAVIGGGFIGWEITAALAMNGKQVTMLFPEKNIGERIYPPDLAQFITDYYREKGVTVLNGEEVTGLDERGGKITLHTKGGKSVSADAVIAGIGIQLNTALAEAAGVRVDNGILVDEFLSTNVPDVYAAGDVASFMNTALNRRLRVEHEDNANTMGKFAGQNMAGRPLPYDYLPFFYSDLFDLGYEAVGELDPRLDIVADWKKTNDKGVIYYLRDGQVRGVLLWNVWDKVDAARELIQTGKTFTGTSVKGQIPME
jgi:3-phenylpropionate/trans-cinnamate dioxygenase ferredoxin reductase subunit